MELKIHYDRIAGNYNKLSAKHRMAAVLKANGYGFGLEKVSAELLAKTDCDLFFVDTIVEAKSICDLNKKKFDKRIDVIVLRPVEPDEIEFYKQYKCIPVIQSERCIEQHLDFFKICEKIALFFETGFYRTGLEENFVISQFENGNNKFFGIIDKVAYTFSHLKESLKFTDYTLLQKTRFETVSKYFPLAKKSLIASRGLNLTKDYYFDFARIGAALYGNCIVDDTETQQAFDLFGKILYSKTVENNHVGYGYKKHGYIGEKSHVAMLDVGYSHGVNMQSLLGCKVYCPRLDKYFPIVFGAMSDAMIDFGIDKPIVGEEMHVFSDKNRIAHMMNAGAASILINMLDKHTMTPFSNSPHEPSKV